MVTGPWEITGEYWGLLEITGRLQEKTGDYYSWRLVEVNRDEEKLFGTAGDHGRLLEDTGGLPEITGGYWGLLEITGY